MGTTSELIGLEFMSAGEQKAWFENKTLEKQINDGGFWPSGSKPIISLWPKQEWFDALLDKK